MSFQATPNAPNMTAVWNQVAQMTTNKDLVSMLGVQTVLINPADLAAVVTFEKNHPELFEGKVTLDWRPHESWEVQVARQMYAFNCLFEHPVSELREEFKEMVKQMKMFK